MKSAAVTATGTSTVISLKPLNPAYWDNGEIPARELTAAVAVTAIKSSVGDETYKATLEVSVDQAFTVPVEVSEVTLVPASGVGSYSLKIDMDTVKAVVPTAAYIRVKLTLGGTLPSITYAAWLTEYNGN